MIQFVHFIEIVHITNHHMGWGIAVYLGCLLQGLPAVHALVPVVAARDSRLEAILAKRRVPSDYGCDGIIYVFIMADKIGSDSTADSVWMLAVVLQLLVGVVAVGLASLWLKVIGWKQIYAVHICLIGRVVHHLARGQRACILSCVVYGQLCVLVVEHAYILIIVLEQVVNLCEVWHVWIVWEV